ncbi:MAG: TetR/AcrR family transcriptional regulator [Bacillota bacterium]
MKEIKRTPHMDSIAMASIKVFARYGFHKSTMEDLAKANGFSKAAFYRHFHDKKDLYNYTAEYALRTWQNHTKSKISGIADPLDKFRIMCFESFFFLENNREIRDFFSQDPDLFPMFGHDRFSQINHDSALIIRQVIEEGIEKEVFRPLNVDQAVRFIFSVYRLFIIETYVYGNTTGENKTQLFATAYEILEKGLRK